MKKVQHTAPARGLALIAVLWIVAALAIGVTGITQSVRSETRTLIAQRQQLQARALGEAAIALAVRQLGQQPYRPPWQRLDQSYQGYDIAVEVAVLSGWINPNQASAPLLERLYHVAGGLAPAAAAALAQTTIKIRSEAGSEGLSRGFDSPADLLRVPGVDYDLYARLAPLLSTAARGASGVNPWAAPLPVLLVLTLGNQAQAQALYQQRLALAGPQANAAPTMDTSSLPPNIVSQALGTRYRLQARVTLDDGAQAMVVRDIELRPDARAGLPWRVLGADEWIEPRPTPDA